MLIEALMRDSARRNLGWAEEALRKDVGEDAIKVADFMLAADCFLTATAVAAQLDMDRSAVVKAIDWLTGWSSVLKITARYRGCEEYVCSMDLRERAATSG